MAAMTKGSDSPVSETPRVSILERRMVVLVAIGIVAVMFVGMVGLLFWRERPAPSAVLILRVPASEDGVMATIDTRQSVSISPVMAKLKGDQEVRVPLPPGEYTVKIEFRNRNPILHAMRLADYSYYPMIFADGTTTRPANEKR